MFNFDLARYAFYIYSNKQYFVRSLKRLLRKRSNKMHIPFNIEKAAFGHADVALLCLRS